MESEGTVFENRTKKVTSKRKGKRKLFPFIQKKKHLVAIEARELPEYYVIDVRDKAKLFMTSVLHLDEAEVAKFEVAIYNATARELIPKAWEHKEEITTESSKFKCTYMELLRYFIGAIGCNMNKKDILLELRTDNHMWKSKMFTEAQEKEKNDIDRIKNPTKVLEDPNYKCPTCKSMQVFRKKVQDRSGDESGSLKLWCLDKKCPQPPWRITG